MATTQSKPIVQLSAKHKVTYELRKLLGIISSWQEVSVERLEEPSLHITTQEKPSQVFVNGVLYKEVSKTNS